MAEIVKHLITVLKKKEDDLAAIFLEALKRVRAMTVFHLFSFFFMDAVNFS